MLMFSALAGSRERHIGFGKVRQCIPGIAGLRMAMMASWPR